MELILGGVGQGKRAYAFQKYGFSEKDVFLSPSDHQNRPLFDHLEAWVKATLSDGRDPAAELEAFLAQGFDGVILCDEVGCGVVPAHPEERAWREAVGRLCCALAQRASTVTRVFCGLPMTLKGA